MIVRRVNPFFVLLIITSRIRCICASIYEIEHEFHGSDPYIFSETMFASGRGFFESGTPSISLGLRLHSSLQNTTQKVYVIHFDTFSKAAVGFTTSASGAYSLKEDLCCTPAMKAGGECGDEVPVGGIDVPSAWHKDPGLVEGGSIDREARQGTLEIVPLDLNASVHVFDVSIDGKQFVAMLSCPRDALAFASIVTVEGWAAFRNAHGYVPAKAWGFVPFFYATAISYMVLLAVFLVCMAKNSKYLIRLQWLACAIVVIGLSENAVWVFVYAGSNSRGYRICCPLVWGALAAIILHAVKRATCRCLLLAVACGYGVVHSKLSRSGTVAILLLGGAYATFAANNGIRIADGDTVPNAVNWWMVPVITCDFLFLYWTYANLRETMTRLKESDRLQKHVMYKKLSCVLVTLLAAWAAMAILVFMAQQRYIHIPWQNEWIMHSYWHVAYFFVTLSVCVIWAPSPQTQQYGYSYLQTAEVH